MSHRKRHHRIKLRSVYQWHRYIGVTVALFAILLAVTGMLLNHTGELDLDSTYVDSPWLQDWYGIKGPAHVTAYSAGQGCSANNCGRNCREQHALTQPWVGDIEP